MEIRRLDHLVLTVDDIDTTVGFYVGVLGMREVTFGAGRRAVQFGSHKINLHQRGQELEPKAAHPTPGSADLCFVTADALERVVETLHDKGIPIEEGPVQRTGAVGPITSVYVRDPDDNLVELSVYPADPLPQ